MSATEQWKAVDRMVHTREAVLIALSLCLASCSDLKPGTTARTTTPPQADTRGAQELAPASKPPEAPARPTQPAPQPTQRVSKAKPAPAIASKGAEKLAAPAPPPPVRARERTPRPSEPSVPKTPMAESSDTVTGAQVQALVFKGPPPQARPPQRAGIKVLIWVGLVLAVAALAVVARLYLIRRLKPVVPASDTKEELKLPSELRMKEPVGLPQDFVVAGEP